MISRDIVLLDVISNIDPHNISDIEYLWDVWYNMTLTRPHYDRLKVTLKRLLDHTTDSTSQRWMFGDHVTEKQVCNATNTVSMFSAIFTVYYVELGLHS